MNFLFQFFLKSRLCPYINLDFLHFHFIFRASARRSACALFWMFKWGLQSIYNKSYFIWNVLRQLFRFTFIYGLFIYAQNIDQVLLASQIQTNRIYCTQKLLLQWITNVKLWRLFCCYSLFFRTDHVALGL